MNRIPLTVSLFTAILIFSAALSAAIVFYVRDRQADVALTASQEMMRQSAEIVRLRIAGFIRPAIAIARFSRDWPEVETPPTFDGHPSRQRLISFLQARPQLSSVYLGYEDGGFYLLGVAKERPPDRLKKLGAPQETVILEQIILRRAGSDAMVMRRFLGKSGEILQQTEASQTDFDPRSRPWYKQAIESDGIIGTGIYTFKGTGAPGLTVAQRHRTGVVGVDITLREIKRFLSAEPIADQGLLAVFQSDGELITQSEFSAPSSEGDAAEEAETRNTRQSILDEMSSAIRSRSLDSTETLDIGEQTWVAQISPISFGAAGSGFVGLALPMEAIVSPINQIASETVLISVLMFVASVPVIWVLSRNLSGPLLRLAKDAGRIREFDLTESVRVGSPITEIRALQESMERMRNSLRTFGIYVPKALVRSLIERDEAPQLGGVRRNISVLFTDLEGFTAMSERLEPEEVMSRMSAYFEFITKELIASGATIDKYIGDAVMAFWNAPDDVSDHVANACRAALAVRELSQSETEKWVADGAPPTRVRIGIHCGEALVGNVGSSDRMNYTALGSTVNLASRLEALNRDLGTSILVSADVVASCRGRFEFRDAGKVEVKGFSDPVEIFELVTEIVA